MRQILFSLLLASLSVALPAQDYTLGPDSQPQDGVPKGTVTKFVLPPGKSYPGTPHNCAIYVPAQYDAGEPTPFMIFLDGSQALGNSMRVPVVFDNLIARHDLPPMIGIFVDPGVLPVVSDDAQNRYNRIYEYDSLTPHFAEFLLNELIPEVAKSYNLSKNPDDRGLSGVSTGAVGAFAAAWNRPDQFHRVLSFIGTYVSMKGADALPALVRKTEPKPIRIWMQDGTADHIVAPEPFGSSPFGSWPINNKVMYEALEFAGYDVKFELGTEAHNLKQGGAILPDALRWLWRGYPEPIVVHEPAAAHQPGYDATDRVFSTVYLDKPWQQIGGEYGPGESKLGESGPGEYGPRSLTSDGKGNVYFANAPAGTIDRVDATGKVTQFAEPPNDAPILRMGANDRLYTYQPSTGDIVSSNTATGTASDQRTLARGLAGIDDFVVTQNGAIYFLDRSEATIGRIDAAGEEHVALRLTDLNGELVLPSALALSPDQSLLVVTDAFARYSWSFQIAADGSLVNGEPFYRLEMPETTMFRVTSGVFGAVEDTDGEVYFATPSGIQICMQNGRIVEILNPPLPGGGPLTAIAFAAGANANWIYVAQDGKLFRRPVKVTGANAWTIVKPPKPTL
ncbi:MAG: alpha/beta hydrolase-fold protein [Terracidiphilus sp.]|jgi:sugar lactone lactonase YvrE